MTKSDYYECLCEARSQVTTDLCSGRFLYKKRNKKLWEDSHAIMFDLGEDYRHELWSDTYTLLVEPSEQYE